MDTSESCSTKSTKSSKSSSSTSSPPPSHKLQASLVSFVPHHSTGAYIIFFCLIFHACAFVVSLICVTFRCQTAPALVGSSYLSLRWPCLRSNFQISRKNSEIICTRHVLWKLWTVDWSVSTNTVSGFWYRIFHISGSRLPISIIPHSDFLFFQSTGTNTNKKFFLVLLSTNI